ncbi:MAG: hypothetical protein JWR33_1135 [Naasia sp.]|jgi:hypothetical protein|uniref:LpqB family beta-propeller domain-containing protein n=1 Tax=Naasia sp. TaxID=2546198 RepID=UPI002623282D|nr:LpqB family beta-propeller domain-containing protein [Naasia sp.]MCU1570394.1 hypothetical protein [Naasia sp.]
MSRLRMTRAALAAAVVVALAGCASIPMSGPVNEGDPLTPGEALGFDFRPQGPDVGASQSEILAGFLAAGAGPQDNYQVARQFLTSTFAKEWDPGASVTVHGPATTALSDGQGGMRLMVPAVGRVDGRGRYEEYGKPLLVELPFRMAKEDGEWRITQAPNGIVLSTGFFDRLFAERALYFYDAGFDYLVPDLRWFPSTAEAPTRVVEALLDGPSAPLASPVLVSAFPEGTNLERQSVTSLGGEAVVELNNEVVRADPITQQRMQYQLERSLVGGSIISVRMSVDGSEVEVDPFGSAAPIVQPLVNPRALAGRADQFGFLTADEIAPIQGLSDTIVALKPTAAVYSDADQLTAVLTDGGVLAVRPGSPAVPIDDRGGLVAPSLDSQGFVWTVPGGDPSAIRATAPGRDPAPVAAKGLTDATEILSLAVSRDSARLLTLLRTVDGVSLRVFGIGRDGTGRPLALSDDWFDLVPPAGDPVTATWAADTTVASLGRDEDGGSSVTTQEVGGRVSDTLGELADAVALVGGNGLSGLRALRSDGSVQVLRGSGWQTVATDVAFLAAQR